MAQEIIIKTAYNPSAGIYSYMASSTNPLPERAATDYGTIEASSSEQAKQKAIEIARRYWTPGQEDKIVIDGQVISIGSPAKIAEQRGALKGIERERIRQQELEQQRVQTQYLVGGGGQYAQRETFRKEYKAEIGKAPSPTLIESQKYVVSPEQVKARLGMVESPTAKFVSEPVRTQEAKRLLSYVPEVKVPSTTKVVYPASVEPISRQQIFKPTSKTVEEAFPQFLEFRKTQPPSFVKSERFGTLIRKDLQPSFESRLYATGTAQAEGTMSDTSKRIYEGSSYIANKIRDVGKATAKPFEGSSLYPKTFFTYVPPIIARKGSESVARFIEMGGMIPGGAEVLARKPSLLPTALGAGIVSTVGGFKKQIREDPAQLISDFAVGRQMGVIAGKVTGKLPPIKIPSIKIPKPELKFTYTPKPVVQYYPTISKPSILTKMTGYRIPEKKFAVPLTDLRQMQKGILTKSLGISYKPKIEIVKPGEVERRPPLIQRMFGKPIFKPVEPIKPISLTRMFGKREPPTYIIEVPKKSPIETKMFGISPFKPTRPITGVTIKKMFGISPFKPSRRTYYIPEREIPITQKMFGIYLKPTKEIPPFSLKSMFGRTFKARAARAPSVFQTSRITKMFGIKVPKRIEIVPPEKITPIEKITPKEPIKPVIEVEFKKPTIKQAVVSKKDWDLREKAWLEEEKRLWAEFEGRGAAKPPKFFSIEEAFRKFPSKSGSKLLGSSVFKQLSKASGIIAYPKVTSILGKKTEATKPTLEVFVKQPKKIISFSERWEKRNKELAKQEKKQRGYIAKSGKQQQVLLQKSIPKLVQIEIPKVKSAAKQKPLSLKQASKTLIPISGKKTAVSSPIKTFVGVSPKETTAAKQKIEIVPKTTLDKRIDTGIKTLTGTSYKTLTGMKVTPKTAITPSLKTLTLSKITEMAIPDITIKPLKIPKLKLEPELLKVKKKRRRRKAVSWTVRNPFLSLKNL